MSAATPPWFRRPAPSASPGARVLVVGGGIAGAAAAFHLRAAGLQPIVLEASERLGAGASGNPAALFMPRLELDPSPVARFHEAAFHFGRAWLRLLTADAPGAGLIPCGALQLASNVEAAERLRRLAAPSHWSQIERTWIARPDAPTVAGVPLTELSEDAAGLWFPQGCALRPTDIVRRALAGAQVRFGAEVARLAPPHTNQDGSWRALDGRDREIAAGRAVVLACGLAATAFAETASLPLAGSAGQVSIASPSASTAGLKTAVAGGPYILPAVDGDRQCFGASYEPLDAAGALAPSLARRQASAARLSAWGLSPALDAPLSADRVAVRCVTPDRAPIAGPVPDTARFLNDYAGLRTGDPRADYPPAAYRDGLYVITGLGSRGFLTSPLAGALVAAQIAGRASPVPDALAAAIHPARFLIRSLKRREI